MAATLTIVAASTGSTATFSNVFVDAFNCEPQYAEDNLTVHSQKVVVRGTAIVDAGQPNYLGFRLAIRDGSGRCNSIQLIAGGQTLLSATGGAGTNDSRGWPTAYIEATEIVGTNTVLLRFEIEHHRVFNDANTVTAHQWRQSMSVDAAGKLTRSVNGKLHITRATTGSALTLATNASWDGKQAWADLFRNAIIPGLPGEGWRRESQEFAVDEQGTAMTYSFIDKRHTHDLPDGVLVGDVSCTYERSLTASGTGLAVVTFTADLEGSQGLKGIAGTTPNRKLVEAAVQLARTRIDLTMKRTIVQRLRIEERDLTSGYKIRFEMEAHVIAKNSDSGSTIVPLAYLIGNEFTITRTETRAAPTYGAAIKLAGVDTQYAMVPTYLNNIVDAMATTSSASPMPVASLFTITDANAYGAIVVTVISGAAGVTGAQSMNAIFDGRFQNDQEQPSNDSDGYTRMIPDASSFTVSRYESGLVKMSPMYIDEPELVFQTKKPVVHVKERTETVRMNQAPPKVLRPLPTDAILMGEDWRVAFGRFDAQGNRAFTGIFEREFALYDDGTSAVGYATATAPSGAQLRRWAAPNLSVLPTLSPIATTGSQQTGGSVLVSPSDPKQAYSVPAETFVT